MAEHAEYCPFQLGCTHVAASKLNPQHDMLVFSDEGKEPFYRCMALDVLQVPEFPQNIHRCSYHKMINRVAKHCGESPV
jgi:hypothetical protein